MPAIANATVQPEQALQALYRAFNSRDIDAVLAAMSDDVDWPNAWEGGRIHGKDAIRAYWARQWQEIDPHVEPISIGARADGRVAVDVHQVVRTLDGDLLADGRVVHVYSIVDGLIARMDVEERGDVTVRYVGGPTAVIEIGGLRLLLDPTFDPPGEYPIGERVLTKTQPPAFGREELGPIDAVLLSHDQHPDNLDRLGREIVAAAPLVLSTASAARRLGPPVRALANWESFELPRSGPQPIQATGVPAQHGPDGSEELVGEVTGFVLSGPGTPTVYISGDNASLDVVRTINARLGPFHAAILNAGAARTALAAGAPLTLTSELAAEAVETLGGPSMVPLHFEGWAHFTEGADSLRVSFESRRLSQRLHLPTPGHSIRL